MGKLTKREMVIVSANLLLILAVVLIVGIDASCMYFTQSSGGALILGNKIGVTTLFWIALALNLLIVLYYKYIAK